LERFVRQVGKEFRQIVREDVLKYMDSFKKPESEDPLHMWIGTRNLLLVIGGGKTEGGGGLADDGSTHPGCDIDTDHECFNQPGR